MDGTPASNLIAQAGFVSNEAGRVFEPPCGALELPWLLNVSREGRRKAREALKGGRGVSEAERFGWFITTTEAEFSGLRYLQQKDWRRALKAWNGNKFFNLHNKATLHRALYYSEQSERPDAHIRECLRLYHFLSEKAPDQSVYRLFQEELIEHLKATVLQAHQAGDDMSAAKSMKVLSQTVGPVGVGHLQEQFFGRDLEIFRVDVARVQKELLSYQGLAYPPPIDVLERCDQDLTQGVIPQAAKLSRKLVGGSTELNKVEEQMAQACGIMSQSYSKAGDNRGAKRWLGEALRWEPSAVASWRELPDEDWGDEDSAVVVLPEKEQEKNEAPLFRGTRFLGVQPYTVHREAGESREECLECLYVAGLPILPFRRFAAYRNVDTEEVGYYLRIPMTSWDHMRQGFVILLMSFLLTVGGLAAFADGSGRTDGGDTVELTSQEEERRVQRVKELAQQEAKLAGLAEPTEEQRKKLEELRAERLRILKELEK